MGGGLMQLVAYGAQDIYLTGNPQITFFKVVYRRHTNFSMECIRQTLDGNVNPSQRVSATISRNGDLLTDMHFEIDVGHTFPNEKIGNYTHNIFDTISIEIGGQEIDKHYGHWLEVWIQLLQKYTNT